MPSPGALRPLLPPSFGTHPPTARGSERGGSETANTDYELLCPRGTLVTGIAGLHLPYVYRLGPLTCSDGSVTGTSSANTGGTSFSNSSSSYFLGFPAVYTERGIGGIAARTGAQVDTLFGASSGWNDLTVQPATLCPLGSFLAGIYGKTGSSLVTSIGPICRSAGKCPYMPADADAAAAGAPLTQLYDSAGYGTFVCAARGWHVHVLDIPHRPAVCGIYVSSECLLRSPKANLEFAMDDKCGCYKLHDCNGSECTTCLCRARQQYKVLVMMIKSVYVCSRAIHVRCVWWAP